MMTTTVKRDRSIAPRKIALLGISLLSSLYYSTGARADFDEIIPTVPPAKLVPTATPTPGVLSTPAAQDHTIKSVPAPKNTPVAPNPPTKPQQKTPGLLGPDVTSHNSQAPLVLQSCDNLEAARDAGYAVLSGNVVLSQADTTLWANRAELFSQANSNGFDRAIGKGAVRIEKKPSATVPPVNATAEEVEFFAVQRHMILRGHPKLIRGQEIIQGEVIEFFLDTGQIKIRSASAVLDPQNETAGGSATKGSLGKPTEKKGKK